MTRARAAVLDAWYVALVWLAALVGRHTRWGVQANYGTVTRLGFASQSHAKHYAYRQSYDNFLPFCYDTRDRVLPSVDHTRSSYPVPPTPRTSSHGKNDRSSDRPRSARGPRIEQARH